MSGTSPGRSSASRTPPTQSIVPDPSVAYQLALRVDANRRPAQWHLAPLLPFSRPEEGLQMPTAGPAGHGIRPVMAQLMRSHSEALSRLKDQVASLRRTIADMRSQAEQFRETPQRLKRST